MVFNNKNCWPYATAELQFQQNNNQINTANSYGLKIIKKKKMPETMTF